MLNETDIDRVYLACGSTDLRKLIDGLAVLVKEVFELDQFSLCLFVFCNRQRDKLKILQWEHNGFWLHYRRLERGEFQWPNESGSLSVKISRREQNVELNHKLRRSPFCLQGGDCFPLT